MGKRQKTEARKAEIRPRSIPREGKSEKGRKQEQPKRDSKNEKEEKR